MSERQTAPVSQTLPATGSTYRRRIGSRERAGARDKRRIADGVRWRYDGPGECTLLRVLAKSRVDIGHVVAAAVAFYGCPLLPRACLVNGVDDIVDARLRRLRKSCYRPISKWIENGSASRGKRLDVASWASYLSSFVSPSWDSRSLKDLQASKPPSKNRRSFLAKSLLAGNVRSGTSGVIWRRN